MKLIFIGGAYFATNQNDIEVYPYIANYLKNKYPNKTIIEPNNIELFRQNYKNLHPDITKNELDKNMVEYDLDYIRNCNLMIADITNKSTGLGIELGIIKERNKNVEFIAKAGSKVSDMITGAFSNTQINFYSSLEDLNNILEKICKKYF